MSTNTLPGIVKIQIVRCSDIQPHAMQMSMCGALVALALPAETIKFYGVPSLKWTGSPLNGGPEENPRSNFQPPTSCLRACISPLSLPRHQGNSVSSARASPNIQRFLTPRLPVLRTAMPLSALIKSRTSPQNQCSRAFYSLLAAPQRPLICGIIHYRTMPKTTTSS